MVHMADRKLEEAAASFGRAVAAAPRSANFRYNLARAQNALNQTEDAKKTLTKALERQPDHVPTISALAAIEMREGNTAQALARARALQQNQDAAIVTAGHVLEGDLHMMQREFQRAARTYEVASKQAQNGALAIRSYQARRQANIPNAARPLEEWLANQPEDTRVRLALAQAYEEGGHLQQAAAEYERILKHRPDNVAALNNLAWIYGELGDTRALQTAERAHALRPDNGAITDTLGWVLVRQGEVQRGLELLRKAVQQAPNTPTIRYHLAVALAEAGAKKEARDTLAELVNSGQVFKDLPKAKQLLQEL
jgi:putative PEP-CTERM system TPR-repeat lipoprotein